MLPADTQQEPALRSSLSGFRALALFLLVLLPLCALLASPVSGDEWGEEQVSFELRSFAGEATPPLPDPSVFPVQLVIDDDGAEGVFGLVGASARQFLWFNRFANPGSGFHLEEIWVLFPSGMDVPVGGAIQLAIWLDPDADPVNGATLLATHDDVIQVADGDTFSVYSLPSSVSINETGEILIGVLNRFFQPGDPPPTQPAAMDTTASQDRSYFALWAGDAPDPPDLTTATTIALLDGAVAGNFMIRGFGTGSPVTEIPTLSQAALVVFALLLLAFSVRRLRVQPKTR